MLENYERLATGRHHSLFANDLEAHAPALLAALQGSRVAVIGAAGSIGMAVVKTLLRFKLGAVTLFDLDENGLVEVVRDLRATPGVQLPVDFQALPIAIGSWEFARYFADTKPFDYILNLSAMKHVRSEKDPYSLARLLKNNVLFLDEFLSSLSYSPRKVFSVSSDKATNPANLMGASKMAMEKVLNFHSDRLPYSTARFANVAFSKGSLPFGFLQRIEKGQPLSAPSDVRRFFMSHEEAGQLCVLACVLGANREVFFPKLECCFNEKTFSSIAEDLLKHLGFVPLLCASEKEAIDSASRVIADKKWPCYFTKSDTSGEKEFEEFFDPKQDVDFLRFESMGVIRGQNWETASIQNFLKFLKGLPQLAQMQKSVFVQELLKVVPELKHIETGKSLDQKM